jgi:hypothetical protein
MAKQTTAVKPEEMEEQAATSQQEGLPFEQAVKVLRPDGSTMTLDQCKSETLKALRKEPRIATVVHSELGKEGKAVDIGINGVIYRIKPGETVELPKSIVEVYQQSAKTIAKNNEFAKQFEQK